MAQTAPRVAVAASDQHLFQRQIAFTSGGAVAGVSDVVPTLTTPQQGQKELLQLQQPQLEVPSSPSRPNPASDGDTDMTTLIIDIQVRFIISS
jgi:hypothetical protein